MQVDKKISVKGSWVKVGEDIKAGQIITVENEGEVDTTGKWGDRNIFKVKLGNEEKNLSINPTSMNYLIDAYGSETKEWIGKEMLVWVEKQMIDGKRRNIVYLTAPDWVETEDGYGPPAEKKSQATP